MMSRRGFTLIEAIIAIVVLSLAVPATMAMIHDATVARTDSVLTTRAAWLAGTISEQILADATSTHADLGMGAFEDPSNYLHDPGTGLFARLSGAIELYESYGMSCEVDIGPAVSATFTPSGDAARNIYRQITVTVRWGRASGPPVTMPVSFIVVDGAS